MKISYILLVLTGALAYADFTSVNQSISTDMHFELLIGIILATIMGIIKNRNLQTIIGIVCSLIILEEVLFTFIYLLYDSVAPAYSQLAAFGTFTLLDALGYYLITNRWILTLQTIQLLGVNEAEANRYGPSIIDSPLALLFAMMAFFSLLTTIEAIVRNGLPNIFGGATFFYHSVNAVRAIGLGGLTSVVLIGTFITLKRIKQRQSV